MIDAIVPVVGPRAATLDAILALQDECGDDGWDGDRALAVSTETIARAIVFFNALPEDVPMPRVFGENNGAVGFDWTFTAHRYMDIQVKSDGCLHYTMQRGTDHEHGVVTFDGKTVPDVIVSGIRRVMG